MTKDLGKHGLKAICDILAHTSKGFSKSELSNFLLFSDIRIVDKGFSNNKYTYYIGTNKRNWLYECLEIEIDTNNSYGRIYKFIQLALDPKNHTSIEKRARYEYLFEEVNKVLLLSGIEITKSGILQEAVIAQTLDEVDLRVNNLQRQLYNRVIHHEVKKYCIKDYLRKDYHDTVFEAAKGLAERVRLMTGLTTDGSILFQTAFSIEKPCLAFNTLKTSSEKSEFNGLKELLQAIFHLVRNPLAHTPKINWKTDENKALDILTLISFAHKYLDECYPIPKA